MRLVGSKAKAPRIAINGRFLEEVQTRLEYLRGTNLISLASRPADAHQVIRDNEGVTLRTPSMTALQIYYDGVLPADRKLPIELTVGREKLGRFVVEWLRRIEPYEYGEPVLIRFTPVPKV